MTPEETRQVQMVLTCLTEKRDKTIKGQTVCNGKPTQEWPSQEESAKQHQLKGHF